MRGGTTLGFPSLSSATNTRYALEVCVRFPDTMSSDSTRTPTSSEVVPTSFTDALTVRVSPTCAGARKDISSIDTVTHIPPACLIEASPAAVSTSFITTPP